MAFGLQFQMDGWAKGNWISQEFKVFWGILREMKWGRLCNLKEEGLWILERHSVESFVIIWRH